MKMFSIEITFAQKENFLVIEGHLFSMQPITFSIESFSQHIENSPQHRKENQPSTAHRALVGIIRGSMLLQETLP
jgi:hypothetical protein